MSGLHHEFIKIYVMYFSADMKKLSNREIEVLQYSAQGYTAKEIARLTRLQPVTIQAYIRNIQKKLGAKNMVHAVSIAHQKGWIEAS